MVIGGWVDLVVSPCFGNDFLWLTFVFLYFYIFTPCFFHVLNVGLLYVSVGPVMPSVGVGCYSDQMSPTLVRLYDDERRKNTAGCDEKEGVERVERVEGEGEEEEGLAYCLTELEACMDHVDDPIRKVAAGCVYFFFNFTACFPLHFYHCIFYHCIFYHFIFITSFFTTAFLPLLLRSIWWCIYTLIEIHFVLGMPIRRF